MKAETRRRWWSYALPAAGLLLLLLAFLDHNRRKGEQVEATSRSISNRDAAQTRTRGALYRWMASTLIASKHARDQSARRRHGELNHLSELDRTPEEDQLLWVAEEKLVLACMRSRGFTYLPNPTGDDPKSALEHSRVDRGDVDAARAAGYGLFKAIHEGESQNDVVDRNAESLARMTSKERGAFLEALRGPAISPADPSVWHMVESVPLPGGGAAYWYRDSCLAQARRQLYGEDYEHNELGYSHTVLREELLAHADADREYRDSLAAWRDCMRARGFDEERPAAAANRLAKEYREGKLSLDELRAQEVAIATADAECYAQTDIERSRQAAESRAEEKLLVQNRERLVAMKRERDEALERAENLLLVESDF